MSEYTVVAKLKNKEPESFIFVTLSSDFGTITRTWCSAVMEEILVTLSSDFRAITQILYPAVTESELWSALHKKGIADDEITALIESARANPV